MILLSDSKGAMQIDHSKYMSAILSEAYGGEAMKKPRVSERHKRFKGSRENVEDDEKSGCPKSHRTDEKVEKVRTLVHSEKRLSIRAMAVQLNLRKETMKKTLNFTQRLDSLHENAPTHQALSVKEFLAQKSIIEKEHRPYSPNFTPRDFWLFLLQRDEDFRRLKTSPPPPKKSDDGIGSYFTTGI
jgi:hypothetical protein